VAAVGGAGTERRPDTDRTLAAQASPPSDGASSSMLPPSVARSPRSPAAPAAMPLCASLVVVPFVALASVSLLPPLQVEAHASDHTVYEVGFGTALDATVYLIFDTSVTFVLRVAVDGRDGSTGWVVAAVWKPLISGAVGGLRGALATVDTVGVAGAAGGRTVRFQRALWGV